MFLIKLFRYICGVVVFSAKGGFFERFINLCSVNKINIRDVSFSENTLKASVNPKKYKMLRDVAKRSGMTLKVQNKYGMPFFIRKNKNRVGLIIGAVIFAVFMVFTSSFIWTVEVSNTENVSSADVIKACEKLGLKQGTLKRKIDSNELSRLLMIELSGKVSWLSVNIRGTRAVVELRAYEPWRKDTTYKEPCNIVADFDGLLLYMEVYNGVKAAKEGNGVSKGDLLISGIVENRDTSSQFLEARGKITALHNDSLSLTIKENERIKSYTEYSSIKVLNIFGLKIPLGFFDENKSLYDEFNNEKHLNYGKARLPISLNEITRAYYEKTVRKNESLICEAVDCFSINMYEKYKNTLVLKSQYSLEEKNGNIKIKSESECIDFLGEKQIIYIE